MHERTRFLEKAIAEDSSIRVRAQAILSLGRLVATQADTTIMRYACHRSAKLRLAVAQSLSTSSNPKTIKCLIKLSTDRASIVRDWATFMLGLQREKGSPIIVKALKKRLKDTSRFVRFEAITALICHKQIEVSLHLEDELERKHVDYVLINAVQELAYLAENNIKKSQKKSKARKK